MSRYEFSRMDSEIFGPELDIRVRICSSCRRMREGPPKHTRNQHSRIRQRGAALVLAAVLMSSAAASASAAGHGAGPWLGLAAGHVGEYRWSVETRRPDGAGGQGARRPCLLVGTIWQTGAFDYQRSRDRECASSAGLSPTGPPLVASGAQPSTGAPPKVTAIGMIAAPAVRRIRVTFGDGSKRMIRLAALNPLQRQKADLGSLRYAGFAIHGQWCAERLVAESASGRTLWDSDTDGYSCADHGPPRFIEG